MKKYALRRLLITIPALFGLLVLVFLISHSIPGDPARLFLGPTATNDMIEAYRERWGLNQPITTQFVIYITALARGDLGYSRYTSRPVIEDLIAYLPATVELTTAALIISVMIGVPLGIIAAMSRNRWPDSIIRIFSMVGVSTPEYWSGIIAQLVLSFGFGLFPSTGRFDYSLMTAPPHVTGLLTVDSILALDGPALLNSLYHLILPAVILGLPHSAEILRFVRSQMIEESTKDYIMTVKANGFPRNLVIYKYMLKNALSLTVTFLGLIYGILLGGAILVESVFAWPGIGRYVTKAILYQDFNPVQAVVMLIGVGYIIINIVVDTLYGFLDPRVRK